MFARILAAVVVVAAAAMAIVLAWPQVLGLEQSRLVAQAVAMRGLAAAIAIVLVVVLTLFALLWVGGRRFIASLAIVALLFAGINGVVLASRGFGGPGFPTPGDGAVTVLSWNTLGEAPSAEDVADLIVETAADVAALPESTWEYASELVAILASRGVVMQPFTSAYDTISKSRSTTILVSAELGEYRADTSAPTTSVLPSVVAAPVDGDGPTFVGVHAVAPVEGDMAGWRFDLQWLAAQCSPDGLAGAPGGVIMAGDFNSTIDHWARLASPDTPGAVLGSCVDSAAQADAGGLGTWPAFLPQALGSPIDHVVHSAAWRTTGFRVIGTLDGSGSDHRPILAQLEPAG